MKISRKGSRSDHGLRSINIDKPDISWNSKEEVIQFQQYGIGNFTGYEHHDYIIKIPLSEIKKIIEIIGEEPVNEIPDTISRAFSPCLRQIIRIEKTCIGKI